MVRIGGKGMTRNRYVVLNCPTLMGNRLCYSKEIRQCADCTDCVIKRVIERCKENLGSLETYVDVRSYECTMLQDILDLFDIEEMPFI